MVLWIYNSYRCVGACLNCQLLLYCDEECVYTLEQNAPALRGPMQCCVSSFCTVQVRSMPSSRKGGGGRRQCPFCRILFDGSVFAPTVFSLVMRKLAYAHDSDSALLIVKWLW